MQRRSFLLVLGLGLLLACGGNPPPKAPPRVTDRPIVILVSIDGGRWDYLSRYAAPTLSALAARGVRAEGLIPIFPSKTFPNHYTIVTGLYPNRHGLISNTMVDPALPGRFSLGAAGQQYQQDTRWWGGEPIWVTAERQGLYAATMFWPGSDVEIAGERPSRWRLFDDNFPNADRVDQILAWLREPGSTAPTFATLYFSDVDSAGHDGGPESTEVREAITRVDAMIARLVEGLEQAGLMPRTNLVIVSDHGMAALSAERVIVLDDYVNLATVDVIDWSPVLAVNPRSGSAEALYRALKDRHPAMQVFRKNELPSQYRLAGHPRLPAVIGIADEGWTVTSRDRVGRVRGGNHGYDPKHRSMQGLFIATGPAFKSGVTVPAFENVHVYELLCRLLGIKAAPNDGDPQVTLELLR